jgi:serine/threonine-protein kinase RsbW
MDFVLDLELPATPEYVAITRLVVGSVVATRRTLIDERVDDLKLAVSEASTNAIEAHQAHGYAGPIRVSVFEAADRIEVHVADHGGGFDPAVLPPHPPVTDPDRLNFERGLGIPLIRSLMDEVEFIPSDTGMVVRMVLFGGAVDLATDADGGGELSEVALDEQ